METDKLQGLWIFSHFKSIHISRVPQSLGNNQVPLLPWNVTSHPVYKLGNSSSTDALCTVPCPPRGDCPSIFSQSLLGPLTSG